MTFGPSDKNAMNTNAEILVDVFKQCPLCGETWPNREAFLTDPRLNLIGYQANFKRLGAGLFLFNHSCKTSMGIKVRDFRDLYNGPVFSKPLTGSKYCLEYCLIESDLRPCPALCECAWVREMIQIIQNWPKRSRAPRK
jgi:hypothetical protein